MKQNLLIFSQLFILFFFLGCGCSRKVSREFNLREPRVVSLAPNLTEIICAVGGGKYLVGRTSACDYPPDIIERIPVIGGFGKPCIESLLSVKPTLVLDVALEDETIGKLIEQIGLKRKQVKCATIDDIPQAILTVGHCLNCDEIAYHLAEKMQLRVVELRAAIEKSIMSKKVIPSVYVEIWPDPLTTVGKSSFVSEVIHLAGGKNIGDQIDKKYFVVLPEWVLQNNPDVIVCFYMEEKTNSAEYLATRTGWSHVRAVKNKRVYAVKHNAVILRPGPRVLEGIDIMKSFIAGN